jgi:hypothetical protein
MGCEAPRLQYIVIVADYCLAQVSMGILPTGHTPSADPFEYSQGLE